MILLDIHKIDQLIDSMCGEITQVPHLYKTGLRSVLVPIVCRTYERSNTIKDLIDQSYWLYLVDVLNINTITQGLNIGNKTITCIFMDMDRMGGSFITSYNLIGEIHNYTLEYIWYRCKKPYMQEEYKSYIDELMYKLILRNDKGNKLIDSYDDRWSELNQTNSLLTSVRVLHKEIEDLILMHPILT